MTLAEAPVDVAVSPHDAPEDTACGAPLVYTSQEASAVEEALGDEDGASSGEASQSGVGSGGVAGEALEGVPAADAVGFPSDDACLGAAGEGHELPDEARVADAGTQGPEALWGQLLQAHSLEDGHSGADSQSTDRLGVTANSARSFVESAVELAGEDPATGSDEGPSEPAEIGDQEPLPEAHEEAAVVEAPPLEPQAVQAAQVADAAEGASPRERGEEARDTGDAAVVGDSRTALWTEMLEANSLVNGGISGEGSAANSARSFVHSTIEPPLEDLATGAEPQHIHNAAGEALGASTPPHEATTAPTSVGQIASEQVVEDAELVTLVQQWAEVLLETPAEAQVGEVPQAAADMDCGAVATSAPEQQPQPFACASQEASVVEEADADAFECSVAEATAHAVVGPGAVPSGPSEGVRAAGVVDSPSDGVCLGAAIAGDGAGRAGEVDDKADAPAAGPEALWAQMLQANSLVDGLSSAGSQSTDPLGVTANSARSFVESVVEPADAACEAEAPAGIEGGSSVDVPAAMGVVAPCEKAQDLDAGGRVDIAPQVDPEGASPLSAAPHWASQAAAPSSAWDKGGDAICAPYVASCGSTSGGGSAATSPRLSSFVPTRADDLTPRLHRFIPSDACRDPEPDAEAWLPARARDVDLTPRLTQFAPLSA